MKTTVMRWSALDHAGRTWFWLSRVGARKKAERAESESGRWEAVLAVPAETVLTEAQASGAACVKCGLDYLKPGPTPRRFPVGITHLSRRAMACYGPCAASYIVPTGLRMSTTEPPQEGSS